MENAAKYLKILCIAIALAACAVWADGDSLVVAEDTSSVLPPSAADTAASARMAGGLIQADTATALHGPEPLPPLSERPRYDVNYAGVSLSLVIPGSGQLYQGRYWMGAGFLVATGAAAAFTAYWWDEADWRRGSARRLRDSASVNMGLFEEREDSLYLRRAEEYGVAGDQAVFEARQAKYTAYSALSWAVGIYVYNSLDALGAGGVSARGEYRNPTVAGFLAAVPFLGLGQLYNGKPGKAGMIAMAQTSMMVTAVNHHRLMSYASDRYNEMRDPESVQYAYRTEYLSYWEGRYDRSFSRRNTYLWISLAAYFYSIMDAVVDAHLSDYQQKIDIGTDLAVSPTAGGLMLTLAYRF